MARWTRLCSVSFYGQGNREANWHIASQLLEQALWEQPDLILLPETFTGSGMSESDWFNTAETLDGETVCRMQEIARRGHTYIACPILLKHRSAVYNAIILLDRHGEVVGSYYKMFPTLGELSLGVTPGVKATVIETDFGKVGFAICFDLNFREVADDLHAQGAELVCFSSMYPGGMQLQHWALEHQWWMLSAIGSPQGMLVDPLGRVRKTAQPNYQPVLSASINLDCLVAHLDYNYEKLQQVKRDYGDEVELDIVQPEARFLLINHRRDTSAAEIAKRYDLLLWDDYFRRARQERSTRLTR
ncbi:MAG: carbon-nitrogen hydrolase family protein [bacterium]|nr:carbon-nitrogen hydrolase family protein [bacterium]